MTAYERVKARIPAHVTLIAVSKLQSVAAIRELYELGQRDFGENYVQELRDKAEKLEASGCHGIRWHFIGHLQTNKVRLLIPHVFAVHSLDSIKLARELERCWKSAGRENRLPVFIEVNIDQESSKSGVSPGETAALAQELSDFSALKLEGLMCVPKSGSGEKPTAGAFSRLKDLELRCRPFSGAKLSMGMSSDFEVAITEGATHVRVGTALFGERTASG